MTLVPPNKSVHTTGVTGGICRTELTTDSGETDGDRRCLADLVEKRGAGQITDVMGDLENTVSTGTLGMDDTFWTARSRPELTSG